MKAIAHAILALAAFCIFWIIILFCSLPADARIPETVRYHLHFHVQRVDVSYTENLIEGDYETWGECVIQGNKRTDELMATHEFISVEFTCFGH